MISPMLALGFENILFLLLIVVALLFQLLSRVVSAANKDTEEDESEPISPPPRTPTPMPRPRPLSDQERVRQFLEALGQPTTAKPPPPVTARPTYKKPVVLPHVPPFGSPLPPLTTRPPESEPDWLPHEIRLPGQIQPTRQTKVFRPQIPEPRAFEVHEPNRPLQPPPAAPESAAEGYAIATEPAAAPPRSETNITALLRSTSGLRDAIVLREIFGPPRSLQPLELTNII